MSKILKGVGIAVAVIATGGLAVCIISKVKKGTFNPFGKKQDSPAQSAAAPAAPAAKPEDKKPEAPEAKAPEKPKQEDKA